MKWLITAFEPFAGASTNSSWTVLENLRNLKTEPAFVFSGPVPVTFSGAWEFVHSEIKKQPDLDGVLCLGQSEKRERISLERVALNCIDARIADNSGETPTLKKITNGPDLYWSSIPWEGLESSADWDRSYSAGTYVCNALMYQVLSWAQSTGKRGGFVHIPVLTSQDEPTFFTSPKMDDAIATKALLRILDFIADL